MTNKYLIEKPNEETSKVIIFLPGVSGGASSERFLPLVHAAHEAGFAIARLDLWNSAEEIHGKSLHDFHQEMNAIVAELKGQGFADFFLIGKSFGGALALTDGNPNVRARVLWAPAIGATKGEGNIDKTILQKLDDFRSLLELTVDKGFLAQIAKPTLIIHGTADKSIPLANSELLASLSPEISLHYISGADHSYRDPEHERQVISETIRFLTAPY